MISVKVWNKKKEPEKRTKRVQSDKRNPESIMSAVIQEVKEVKYVKNTVKKTLDRS